MPKPLKPSQPVKLLAVVKTTSKGLQGFGVLLGSTVLTASSTSCSFKIQVIGSAGLQPGIQPLFPEAVLTTESLFH